MYIRILDKNIPLTVPHYQCVEKLMLGINNKRMRDDKGVLHIGNKNNKYIIHIRCDGFAVPGVLQSHIGALCEIELQTKLYEYVDDNQQISRKYQDGSLGRHELPNASPMSLSSVKTYDKTQSVQEAGIYSYLPIIEAYLLSVESTKTDKGVQWLMIFEEK